MVPPRTTYGRRPPPGLLKIVECLNRDEWDKVQKEAREERRPSTPKVSSGVTVDDDDSQEDSPDPLSSGISATQWKSAPTEPKYPTRSARPRFGLQNNREGSPDELSSKNTRALCDWRNSTSDADMRLERERKETEREEGRKKREDKRLAGRTRGRRGAAKFQELEPEPEAGDKDLWMLGLKSSIRKTYKSAANKNLPFEHIKPSFQKDEVEDVSSESESSRGRFSSMDGGKRKDSPAVDSERGLQPKKLKEPGNTSTAQKSSAFVNPSDKYKLAPEKPAESKRFENPVDKYPLPSPPPNQKSEGRRGFTDPNEKYRLSGPVEKKGRKGTKPPPSPPPASKFENPFDKYHLPTQVIEGPREEMRPLFKHDDDAMSLVSSQLSTADSDSTVKCKLCEEPIPSEFLETWKRTPKSSYDSITWSQWAEICSAHKKEEARNSWMDKGYPIIEWESLTQRVEEHIPYLKRIITDKAHSRFNDEYSNMVQETRGNAAKMMRTKHKMHFSGYYGLRGDAIFQSLLTSKLGATVRSRGGHLVGAFGVSGYVGSVLVPSLVVKLIQEDMDVHEERAAEILDESNAIGAMLNGEAHNEDVDGDDNKWVDINATQNQKLRSAIIIDSDSDY